MQDNSIKPEQMTPDQARSVLKAIAESEGPRIRVYGEMLKRMRMFYRLRSGVRGERIGPYDMVANLIEEQGREWLALYSQIRALLQQFGKEDDSSGEKDYLLVSDNLGLWQHRIETSNLEMVKPVVIKSLQKLLSGYPNWEIAITIGSPGKEKSWPSMCLIIGDNEIIDGLQRQYFPEEYKTIEYEGSRPLGSRFGDVIYSQPQNGF